MISRRQFVTSSAAAAAASSLVIRGDAQSPIAAASTTTNSSPKNYGPEWTANRLIKQKLKKLTKDASYNAFESGELAVSMRYVFEHMHRTGLTSQVEAAIKKNGVPPLTADDIGTHFTRLRAQGINLSPEMQQSITTNLTENSQAKSEAFTNLVKQHGLWVVHDGIYDLAKRISGTKPVNPKMLSTSTLTTESVKSGTLEPMLSCDGDGDGDGDGEEGHCSDGDGDGDGGVGDGGGVPTSGPGSPGDVDTAEYSNGTIVYEGLTQASSFSLCQIINSIIALGAGLSAAAIAGWAETDAAAAAAFAAGIATGLTAAGLIALLGGIVAIGAYEAVFC